MNAYTAISGSANPTYDPNGNLLTGPIAAALASLTYDQENRLTTSNLGGSVNSYTYDALGRISTLTYSLNGVSTTEVYTWTGWTLLYRELIQNAVAIEKYRYTWGLDVSGTLEGAGGVGGLLAIERNVNNNYSWDIRYPHYDANGNIMALSNSSGQISARYRYDAFGKTILSTDVDGTGWNTKNIHGFSTKPTLGKHKIHYYGYRWYDASNGRWINRDPIEESGGLNLYGFVDNNALNFIDILGLKIVSECYNDVWAGHAGKDAVEAQKRWERDKGKCDMRNGVMCYGNISGRPIWPNKASRGHQNTPEDRIRNRPQGLPTDELMVDALYDRIKAAEKQVPIQCMSCCDTVTIRVTCDGSKSMDAARKDEPERMSKYCGYRNTFDCKSKKWASGLLQK